MNFRQFYKQKLQIYTSLRSVDRALLGLLYRSFPRPCRIIEAGCHTAHLSYKMARIGYTMTLLDILDTPLKIAERKFHESRLPVETIHSDIMLVDGHWHGLWNSGVIQCYPPEKRELLIKKMCSIAHTILLIYPTVEDRHFPRQNKDDVPPGIVGCKEYPVNDIPSIMSEYCHELYHGSIPPDQLGLAYPFEYVIGKPS